VKKPDLDRIVETFVPIAVNPSATGIQAWQDYKEIVTVRVIAINPHEY
jgi:hypothetical protein